MSSILQNTNSIYKCLFLIFFYYIEKNTGFMQNALVQSLSIVFFLYIFVNDDDDQLYFIFTCPVDHIYK